jgi:HAE1 family hydrophobic/amphiphilic exporter-1
VVVERALARDGMAVAKVEDTPPVALPAAKPGGGETRSGSGPSSAPELQPRCEAVREAMAGSEEGASSLASARDRCAVRQPSGARHCSSPVVVWHRGLGGVEIRELRTSTARDHHPHHYDGATPARSTEITAVIEGAVARTAGVVSISSQSSAGQSRVTIEFDPSTDLNAAANDLRDAIGALRSLPDDSEAPTIVKADTNSDAIMLSVTPDVPIERLTRWSRSSITSLCRGVADVSSRATATAGPHHRPDALTARGLAVNDLTAASAALLDACVRS